MPVGFLSRITRRRRNRVGPQGEETRRISSAEQARRAERQEHRATMQAHRAAIQAERQAQRRAETAARPQYMQIAKAYIDDIKRLRVELKEKRDEYHVENQPSAILEIIKNEFRQIAQKWPRFEGNERVQIQTADPYPESQVIALIGMSDRKNIIKTAILIRREIANRKPFEGLWSIFASIGEIAMFEYYVSKYVNPPSYPYQYEEDDDYDYEEAEDIFEPRYPANPRYGITLEGPPEYTQGRTRRNTPSPREPSPPAYSPGNMTAGKRRRRRKITFGKITFGKSNTKTLKKYKRKQV